MSTKLLVNLGEAQRIPIGEGRQFLVGDQMIAVFRVREGSIYATQASCSHRSGPLADGLVGGAKVVCPLHSYAFDLCSGKALGHTCAALKTYSATINEDGDVLVDIDW